VKLDYSKDKMQVGELLSVATCDGGRQPRNHSESRIIQLKRRVLRQSLYPISFLVILSTVGGVVIDGQVVVCCRRHVVVSFSQ